MDIKKRTVLVVDDEKVNCLLLKNIMVKGGYNVIIANDGKDALDVLKTNNNINVVLLDLIMPIMDGYQVLHEMKKIGIVDIVPVIVVTANDDQENEIKCLEAGAYDFLKKPYNAKLVRNKVDNIIRLFDSAKLIDKLESDSLTGLLNREGFIHYTEDLLNANNQDDYSLVYFNIVHFRMINAHSGKATGDLILQKFSKFIQDYFKDNAIYGRIGADNFGVLVKQWILPSQQEIGIKYSEMVKDFPIKNISIKCGVYNIDDKSVSISRMIDYAKTAEESIKNKYGVYYSIYDSNMSHVAMREHQLTNYMEEALVKKQFVVYLQPKHSTEGQEVAGAEALVRWIHPELGFISPGEFIPLFEKNGFISKLDLFVWQEVCKTLHEWILAGIKPVPISVNASRADFVANDLPEVLDELIEKYDIPPELLHVEVTESAYTDNPEQIISSVAILRNMGFKIEMDDFGSGYSSLNMLSELPIDILKLDMRFMQDGSEQLQGSKKNILSFIVSLSKWLQLPTVAEGVETLDELESLKTMGVDLIQGYYFSKPMPINDFKDYMIEHSKSKNENNGSTVEKLIINNEEIIGEKPIVLVVEDIESNQLLLQNILSNNYNIVITNNGQEGYNYLKDNYKEVSCILLDLLMPVMDGFQLLELIHASEQLSKVPVIITTETGSNGELRALNLGAHSFVSKPYNPDVLKHHVKKAIEEKQLLKFKNDYYATVVNLSEKAYCDELTGFYNRFGVDEALKRLPLDSKHIVIILDIDELKSINDKRGHPVGDEAIVEVSKVIKENVRSQDVIARIGGDEFLIILTDTDNLDNVCKRVSDIIDKVKSKIFNGVQLSCSTGISIMDNKNQFKIAYNHADKALYISKEKGKGTCTIWQEDKQNEN